MRNQVQLIAYADRLGGSIAGLDRLLAGPLAGLIGGVHVLPCYLPYDGADAGFDPADHRAVDPRLGSWADLGRLGTSRDLMLDLIVNHASVHSPQFRDVLARGDSSPYAGMFLTFGRVFPAGATEADLLRIYRPRPGLPFTPVTAADGSRRLVWTTFTAEQVDLDVADPQARRYLLEVLDRMAAANVVAVRLDAAGYAVKTAGTSCFLTPETFVFLADLTMEVRRRGLEVLVEAHAHHRRQVEIARQVDLVYDFALPPLVLHALFTGDAVPLLHWLEIRPHNAVTVLDTHDGIGVVDAGADQDEPAVGGLLAPAAIAALVERIHSNSGGASRLATGAGAANVDVYQVNCTYYDALGRDDRRYLLARLLQFFTPGIPQVYYVGLLAGCNDTDLLARTGVGREINRHRYGEEEVNAALGRPVVAALLRLIRFRNTYPAFTGEFAAGLSRDGRLALEWRSGSSAARLSANLVAATYTLAWTAADGSESSVTDVGDLPFWPVGTPGPCPPGAPSARVGCTPAA